MLVGIGLFWLINLVSFSITGYQAAIQFKSKGTTEREIALNWNNHQEVTLQRNDEDESIEVDDLDVFFGKYKWVMTPEVKLKIRQSKDSLIHLKLQCYSRGKTKQEATQLAGNIQSNISMMNNELKFSHRIHFPDSDKWRGQKATLVLYLPVDTKLVVPDESIDAFIQDTEIQDGWCCEEGTYLMTNEGLVRISPKD